jgi:muconolactone D-isomerase
VDEGHLVRLWRPPAAPGETKALGLYRADSEAQLAGLLGDLPLYDWMHIKVTPLEPHPNDAVPQATVSATARSQP